MKTPTRLAVPLGQRGFTLIELMITVAIVAILAAIAYPAYTDSVWKGRRGEAKSAITRALQAQERNYTQTNTYVAYAYTSPPAGSAFFGYSADGPTNSRYRIDATATGSGLCSGATGLSQCVVVTATVIGSSPDPKCGTSLAMDSQGNKAVSSPGTLDICWGR